MPTSATGAPEFFSTISCAMRTSVRRMSSSSRTTLAWVMRGSFLASRDRVKGTRRKVAAGPDAGLGEPPQTRGSAQRDHAFGRAGGVHPIGRGEPARLAREPPADLHAPAGLEPLVPLDGPPELLQVPAGGFGGA